MLLRDSEEISLVKSSPEEKCNGRLLGIFPIHVVEYSGDDASTHLNADHTFYYSPVDSGEKHLKIEIDCGNSMAPAI